MILTSVGGLQSVSGIVAEAIGGNSDMRGSKSKQADEANSQMHGMAGSKSRFHRVIVCVEWAALTLFAAGSQTTPGTKISGADQMQNIKGGTADHLSIGKQ